MSAPSESTLNSILTQFSFVLVNGENMFPSFVCISWNKKEERQIELCNDNDNDCEYEKRGW
jgi:hypothetical protein